MNNAEVISQKTGLTEAKAAAVIETMRNCNYYRTRGFMPELIAIIQTKKIQLIYAATTKAELKEIMQQPKPHYNGNSFVSSQYSVPEEELICWSECSLIAPLAEHAFQRYMVLFEQVFGVSIDDCTPESMNAFREKIKAKRII